VPASLKEVSEAVDRWNRSQDVVDSIQKERDAKKINRDAAVAALNAIQAKLDLAQTEQTAARANLANVLSQP
jgi:hypothetical protein